MTEDIMSPPAGSILGTSDIAPEGLRQGIQELLSDGLTNGANVSAPAVASLTDEYQELTGLIRQRGLLSKRPGYYAFKTSSTLALLGVAVTFLVVADSLWLQLLTAVFLAFVSGQISFIGHDAGHRQICSTSKRNDAILFVVSFLTGLTSSWWLDKHGRHHGSPNQIGLDDDVEVSALAFTEEQALQKRGVQRFFAKHQTYFFYPILLLAAISFLFAGIHYLVRGNRIKYPRVEPLLVVAYLGWYLGLLFLVLAPWHAVLFILVHKSLEGLNIGSAFAPNHKGMPILARDTELDFLRRQVITSRNIRPNILTDLLYGGLNYQIEHHLFPNIPRNKLGAVREVVKEFCSSRAIPYHETGVLRSQREILGYLRRVSAPLRVKRH